MPNILSQAERRTHIKILQFFLHKNSRTVAYPIYSYSWKLCQIKDSLAFDAAICGSVIQLYTAEHDVLIHLTEDCSPKGQWILIWHNFQDQTSTTKVVTSPKTIGKMPQNILKKIFWKINLIKIMLYVRIENSKEWLIYIKYASMICGNHSF